MAVKFFLLVLVLVLTAFDGSRDELLPPELPVEEVEEVDLSQLFNRRLDARKNINNIVEEDEWFIYEVSLKPLLLGNIHKTSVFTEGCSFSGATYTVIRKDTDMLIRNERISQLSCVRCHRR